MMKTMVVLLCGLAWQVLAGTNGFVPAKIFSRQKMVSEGSDLYFTCSTFGSKKPPGARGFIYLCKGGLVLKKKPQRSHLNDTVFFVRADLHDSGDYSCVYSDKDLPLSTAAIAGLNAIWITIIDISVAGPPAVTEGDHVELTCSVSDALRTLAGCQLIQSYLVKNGAVVRIQAFNTTRMEVNFTIEDAALRDSGHYGCVVLPSKCSHGNQTALYQRNKVYLEVKGRLFDQESVILGVVIALLSLALGLCFMKKRQTADNTIYGNQNVVTQWSSVLEEQQKEAEGLHLEAQNDDSSSTDDENIFYDVEAHGYQAQSQSINSTLVNKALCNNQNVVTQWSSVLEEQQKEAEGLYLEAQNDESFSTDDENIYCDIEALGCRDESQSVNKAFALGAVLDVPVLIGSDNIDSVSPGVQSFNDDDDDYIEPV